MKWLAAGGSGRSLARSYGIVRLMNWRRAHPVPCTLSAYRPFSSPPFTPVADPTLFPALVFPNSLAVLSRSSLAAARSLFLSRSFGDCRYYTYSSPPL